MRERARARLRPVEALRNIGLQVRRDATDACQVFLGQIDGRGIGEMDVVVAPGVEALAEDPPARRSRREASPSRLAIFSGKPSSGSSSSRRMLATLIGMVVRVSGRKACLDVRVSEQRSETDQGDVIDLGVAGGKLADVLEECAADRFGAAGGLGELLDQPALVARVVEFLAEVARVGHAVGEDGDDVARVELDLGLLVIRLGDDPQGKPGDLLADLIDRAVAAADHDGKVARRGDRQGAFLDVEDAQAEGDELLLDAGREEQACSARWRRPPGSSR